MAIYEFKGHQLRATLQSVREFRTRFATAGMDAPVNTGVDGEKDAK